jgi:hypothetical protein
VVGGEVEVHRPPFSQLGAVYDGRA